MSSNSAERLRARRRRARALIEQLQFLGQMSSTEAALFHHHAAAANGLGITDSKTLSALTQEGPMTAGEIAKRLGLTTGAVTNVIDRLVRAGLVRRVADPKDRRKVIVEADLANLEKLSHVYDSVADAFRRCSRSTPSSNSTSSSTTSRSPIEVTKGEIAKLAASGESTIGLDDRAERARLARRPSGPRARPTRDSASGGRTASRPNPS